MAVRNKWTSAVRRNAGIVCESLLVAGGLSMAIHRLSLAVSPRLEWTLVATVALLLAPKSLLKYTLPAS